MKRTHEEIEKFIADELEFGLIEEADVAAERARLAPRHKFKEWTYFDATLYRIGKDRL